MTILQIVAFCKISKSRCYGFLQTTLWRTDFGVNFQAGSESGVRNDICLIGHGGNGEKVPNSKSVLLKMLFFRSFSRLVELIFEIFELIPYSASEMTFV